MDRVLESGLETYSGGEACSRESLCCVSPWYGQHMRDKSLTPRADTGRFQGVGLVTPGWRGSGR
jgi:hypothetical protein